MTLYSCIPNERYFPPLRRGTIRSKTHLGEESDEKMLILLNLVLDIMGRGDFQDTAVAWYSYQLF